MTARRWACHHDESRAGHEWGDRKIFDGPSREGDVGAYNDFWLDLGTNVVDTKRTSLIVDPPDGRLPALTPTARRQAGSLGADLPGERPVRYRAGGIAADGPEDRGVGVRCILGFNSGPPMMPSGHNNNTACSESSKAGAPTT